MATHVSRAVRCKGILRFIHANDMVSDEGSTVGQYARKAGISASPHLRGIYKELLEANILIKTSVNYKAVRMDLYEINRDTVSELYPDIREFLTEIGWQERLL